MPPRVDPERKAKYLALRRTGFNQSAAAREAGISRKTGAALELGLQNSSGPAFQRFREAAEVPAVRSREELCPEALAALDDIELFALRYFGLVLMPWQTIAAGVVVQHLATPDEEYDVLNAPPGSGKSSFFTLVLPAWLTCRDRTVRGLIGSASADLAARYTDRLRGAFERVHPVKVKAHDLALGIAVDAVATLAGDYGRFKPDGDLWRRDSFSVAQLDDVELSEKEATWTAYGPDSAQLGGRYVIVIWDDLYDPRKMRTAEAREALKEWFVDVAETRLEPAGLFLLQGQRMGADDIYRFALDMPSEVEEDEDGETVDDGSRKYHHIVFRAHYDDRCNGDHGRDAAPYPEGCLLYPRRLGWRKLAMQRRGNPGRYEVLYLQEDVDVEGVLVNPLWVSGGRGPDGTEHPGCWDHGRGLCELPAGLAGPLLSVAVADPSPTRYWAVEWWVVDLRTEQRFLMDLVRQPMDAPRFLDFNHNDQVFTGVMEEWQQRSIDVGRPITTWIVEANAAQRFMLQYEHVRRWQQRRSVRIIGHQTHRNKSDPKLGVTSLGPHWQYGRVRLPGRGAGRTAAQKLVDEVTRWPDGRTDDCVMAAWFLEWNLPNLKNAEGPSLHVFRPDYLRAVR